MATGIADPTCFFDCVVDHAFVWNDGKITNLGALPGGQSSFRYLANGTTIEDRLHFHRVPGHHDIGDSGRFPAPPRREVLGS